MTFHREEPNEYYRALRMISAAGVWTLGLSLYASGMRLRMGKTGQPPRVLDFCLGADPALCGVVFAAVLRRLSPLAEGATAAEVDTAFPWAGSRPDLAIHLRPLLSNISEASALDMART